MENWISGLLMVAMLIIGLFAGGAIFSTEKEVIVEKEVEVEKIVEVEVPGEEIIVEVPAPSLLDLAVEDFMKAVEDEEDEAGNEINLLDEYDVDFDEVSIKKIYDDYTIVHDGDEYSVEFSIKLKFDEEDEKSERVKYNVLVEYEEDEDTEVTIL